MKSKFWNKRRDALESGRYRTRFGEFGFHAEYDSLRSLELAAWRYCDELLGDSIHPTWETYDERFERIAEVRGGAMALMIATGGNFVDVY